MDLVDDQTGKQEQKMIIVIKYLLRTAGYVVYNRRARDKYSRKN